jgi:adenine phosphoribosyltransferase
MADVIRKLIRDVPDFPKPGILFRDITPLLRDPRGLNHCIDLLTDPFRDAGVDIVAGVESRGFIFGTLVSQRLGKGFVPIRKPGKLPCETVSASYELEYGTDTVEIHRDAVEKGQRVLLVDDLIATGGTLEAARKLVTTLGGEIVGCSIVIELAFLKGRDRLPGLPINALLTY